MGDETTDDTTAENAPPLYMTIHSTWPELDHALNVAAAGGYHLAHDLIDRGGSSVTMILRRQELPPAALGSFKVILERALDALPDVLADVAAGKKIDELDLLQRVLGTKEIGLAVVKNISGVSAPAEVPSPAETTERFDPEFEHPTP